jgi:hypothetical protein
MKKSISIAICLLLATFTVCKSDGKVQKGRVTKTVMVEQKRLTARQKLPSNPNYQEAVKKFKDKNYAEALKLFSVLDSTGFCCDLIHYYIGQCYQNTNQTVAAGQHYDWVVANSKDNTLVAYANYANDTMQYYNAHRTYAGQGNNFAKYVSTGGVGRGRRIGFG